MTLENLRNYLETAEEKYPISTEFTKDYQQSRQIKTDMFTMPGNMA